MPKLQFVPTHAPLRYDPSLPNFKPPKSYEGSKVRIKVAIPDGTADYWKLLDKARIAAEEKYKGAQVYALPDFEEKKDDVVLDEDIKSDAQLVELYVKGTLPPKLADDESKIVAYLLHKLRKVQNVVIDRSKCIEFVRVRAKNWLSFKECEYEFKPGVTLVSGRNRDWNGGSNGAGKSNFLQFIRAALYGSTTKGQEHNALVHDKFPNESARISATFRNGRRVVKALRRRNPAKCQILIDGIDASSGNRSGAVSGGTEDLISRYVGMTREMFDHSVLIDQRLVSTTAMFLSGTDKQKKELLDEFMGTERFIDAGKLVHREIAKCTREIESYEEAATIVASKVQHIEETIEQLSKDARVKKLEAELAEVKSDIIKKEGLPLLKMKEELDTQLAKLSAVVKDRYKVEKELAELAYQHKSLKEQHKALNALEATCPTCYQVIDETVRRRVNDDFEKRIASCEERVTGVRKKLASIGKKELFLSAESDKKSEDYEKKNDSYQSLVQRKKDLEALLDKAPTVQLIEKQKRRLAKYSVQQKHLKPGVSSANHRLERLMYCERALSRDGLVNYLYAQLCTKLNKAAEHYSELLCDGIINLRFVPYTTRKNGTVVNEFDVQIANAQGGKSRKDQSRGEEQVACLICILALREVGPDCNLLILDEPAEGLEPANAARLAEGFERLTARFPTILIATHNEVIKSHFSDSKGIIIEKRNKVSRIVEA